MTWCLVTALTSMTQPVTPPAERVIMTWCLVLVTALAVVASRLAQTTADECKLTPVVHVLQYPGCVPKPIPSYACVGHCTSYVQVSLETQVATQTSLGDGVASRADQFASRADGVASRADGVASRADGVASRADGVTSRADKVASRARRGRPHAD